MTSLARKVQKKYDLNRFATMARDYANGNNEYSVQITGARLLDVEYGDVYRFKDNSCLVRDYFGNWKIHTPSKDYKLY